MGESPTPTGGPPIPGPIPRDPPPPPGYVDPLDDSPVLEGLVEEGRTPPPRPRRTEAAGPAEEQGAGSP